MPQIENKVSYLCWDDDAISDVLELLKTHSLKKTAEILDTSPQSISKALMRRGISVRPLLKLIQRKPVAQRKSKRFIKPSSCGVSDATIRAITYSSDNGCKYPIGDLNSDNFHFCNARRIKCNYCAKHAALIYQEAA